MRPFFFLVALLAAFGAGVGTGGYFAGGSHLISVATSPDGGERVELYTPSRWRAFSMRRRDLAAFARMTRTRDSRPLGDSGVFDLSGEGQVVWTRGHAQVGSSALYDQGAGRWTVLN